MSYLLMFFISVWPFALLIAAIIGIPLLVIGIILLLNGLKSFRDTESKGKAIVCTISGYTMLFLAICIAVFSIWCLMVALTTKGAVDTGSSSALSSVALLLR